MLIGAGVNSDCPGQDWSFGVIFVVSTGGFGKNGHLRKRLQKVKRIVDIQQSHVKNALPSYLGVASIQ